MAEERTPYIGPGAVRDARDERDLPFRELLAAGAVAPVTDEEWRRGYDAHAEAGLTPENRDQGSRLTCVCETCAAYGRVLRKLATGEDVTFSASSVYPLIALDGGGCYLRDGAKALADGLFCSKAAVPDEGADGTPISEVEARRAERVTPAASAEARKLDAFDRYRMVEGGVDDIGVFAAAIRTGHGAILGFTGTNAGWCRQACRPPAQGEYRWGHGVYGPAFGELDVQVMDLPAGTRCLFIPNSWGGRYAIAEGRWKGYQALPASYFAARESAAAAPGEFVFNAWVVTPASVVTVAQRTADFARIHDRQMVECTRPGDTGAQYLVLQGQVRHVTPERSGFAAIAMIKYGIGPDRVVQVASADLAGIEKVTF